VTINVRTCLREMLGAGWIGGEEIKEEKTQGEWDLLYSGIKSAEKERSDILQTDIIRNLI